MKLYLKILVIVLVFISAGFMSAGLLNPAIEYGTITIINASPAETWNALTNMEMVEAWDPQIENIEVLRQHISPEESVFLVYLKNQPDEMTASLKILSYDSLKVYSQRIESSLFTKKQSFTFSSNGSSTILDGEHQVRGNTYFYRCLFSLLVNGFKRAEEDQLDAMRSWIEQNQQNTTH